MTVESSSGVTSSPPFHSLTFAHDDYFSSDQDSVAPLSTFTQVSGRPITRCKIVIFEDAMTTDGEMRFHYDL